MAPADTAAWLRLMKFDALASATPLAKWKFEGILVSSWDLVTSLAGHMAVGPSPVLILLCGMYLALRRFMDWRIPLAILGSAALTAWLLFAFDPTRYPNPFFMLFSGGLILGAVYMATDMATSPVTPRGMWLYGGLIGLTTVLIRYWGGLPEGVMYAILIGNAASPLIERITQPTPYGKGASGRARKSASYSLHPTYISREDAAADDGVKARKKRILGRRAKK
jgi:electron transport complex protein RnfD